MLEKLEIRDSSRSEAAAIESLYPAAFPDEDLLPLVRDLLRNPLFATSIVGIVDARIVGHAVFTKCGLVGNGVDMALLGPLVVYPAQQGLGIGSAIVRAGLRRLEDSGIDRVFVLGDPAYYRRFGFRPEYLVEPPFAFPADLPPEWNGAWQSKKLGETGTLRTGRLSVPQPWLKPALWFP